MQHIYTKYEILNIKLCQSSHNAQTRYTYYTEYVHNTQDNIIGLKGTKIYGGVCMTRYGRLDAAAIATALRLPFYLPFRLVFSRGAAAAGWDGWWYRCHGRPRTGVDVDVDEKDTANVLSININSISPSISPSTLVSTSHQHQHQYHHQHQHPPPAWRPAYIQKPNTDGWDKCSARHVQQHIILYIGTTATPPLDNLSRQAEKDRYVGCVHRRAYSTRARGCRGARGVDTMYRMHPTSICIILFVVLWLQ